MTATIAQWLLIALLGGTAVAAITGHGRRVPAKVFDSRVPLALLAVEAILIILAVG